MRSSCVGPYLDGFIKTLVARGYSARGVRKFVRPVTHFGRWAGRGGADVASWDQKTLRRFRAHLRRCRCEPNRGVFERAVSSRLFLIAQAPMQPFQGPSSISAIVRRALESAGISNPPSC